MSISWAAALGAFGFGAVVGWNLYFINRYRTGDVKLADLVTLLGAIGGGAMLKLFPAATDLFGFYGIGLAAGFFLYFVLLLVMVRRSKGVFTVCWFLDGRRGKPAEGEVIPPGTAATIHAMEARGGIPPR